VSLILDALRKLEREKGAHEPGVLVVGSVPWGERSRESRLASGGALVLAFAAVALGGWLLRRPAPPQPVQPPPPAAAIAPDPSPVVVASPTPSPVETAAPAAGPPPAIRLSHAPAAAPRERTAAPAGTAPAESAPAAMPSAVPPRAEPATPAKATEELRLSAISQRDGKPVALINDRLVFEGDSIDGVRVLRIGETEVEVEVKGQKRVLRF
jgi:hypothetical protein